MNNDTTTRFLEADWDSMLPRLERHARASIYQPQRILPGGQGPDDIVRDAIDRVITGDRQWNPTKDPDLEGYLKSVIDSILSNNGIFGKAEWGRVSSLDDATDWEPHLPHVGNLGGICHDAALELEHLWAAVHGDDELEELLDATSAGFTKPREIAEVTGIEIERVYELRRKLQLRHTEVRKQLEAENGP